MIYQLHHTWQLALLHLARGKPIVVGEAPSRSGDPNKPITGAVGRRICRLLGVSPPAGHARIVGRANLLHGWPGPSRNGGSAFPPDDAKVAAHELLREMQRLNLAGECGMPRLVLLGLRVAKAFGVGTTFLVENECARNMSAYADPPMPQLADWFHFRALVLPHPSGLSRWWNDPENVRRAGEALRAFVSSPNARLL